MNTSSPRLIAGRASERARSSDARPLVHLAARVGLFSRAVIYGLLAYFATEIAIHGNSPDQASGTGAITEIAHQPGAPLLLTLLSIGLLAYGLWRMTQAIGSSHSGVVAESAAKRIGWGAIGVVYLALFGQAISTLVGSRTSSGGHGSQPAPLVGRVLRWPAGPEVVGFVGVAIVAGGLALLIWACAHKFDKTFETERMSRTTRFAARVSQVFGDVTRGILIALIGIYVLMSAVTDDPSNAKSLGQVLESLARRSYGGTLIGIAALGLLAFAVSSVFEAFYRRV